MKTKIALIFLILSILPVQLHAAKTRNLYIEFSYIEPNIPGKELKGFRLYKDGVQVCQINSFYSQSFECQFPSGNGKFDFTLAALFSDNSLGPRSLPYPVTITPGTITPGNNITPTQTVTIISAISSMLLEKNRHH